MTEKKKRLMWGLLSPAIIGLVFLGCFIHSRYISTPAQTPTMPAEKSTSGAILKEALRIRNENTEKDKALEAIKIGESALVKELGNRGVEVYVSYDLSVYISVPFLQDLLADEKSQKTFKQFSDAKITIYLSDYYHVSPYGGIWIDARKGVKKAAEWLETGK